MVHVIHRMADTMPGVVFVTAAEFLNITEIAGIANLTVRFSIMKFLLMSTTIFLHTKVK